jgi:hypothetical protein
MPRAMAHLGKRNHLHVGEFTQIEGLPSPATLDI